LVCDIPAGDWENDNLFLQCNGGKFVGGVSNIYTNKSYRKPAAIQYTVNVPSLTVSLTPVRNQEFFFYLIYFEIRYLTAIIFDETRITIRATHTKNTDPV